MSRRSNAHKQRVDQTYSYMRKMTSEKDFKANNSTNGTMCKWDPPDEEERQLALGQEVTSPPSLISACHNQSCEQYYWSVLQRMNFPIKYIAIAAIRANKYYCYCRQYIAINWVHGLLPVARTPSFVLLLLTSLHAPP